jgi:hypothetical protein
MQDIEKELAMSLGLSISYMISKNNVGDSLWLKVLNKKKKAIHSGITNLMKM